MNFIVMTYFLYLATSVAMTIWVAKTLSKHGQPFLLDVFSGNRELANSVNQLLVVGFYLMNLGYVSLALQTSTPVNSTQVSIEVLSGKIGSVLLVLGCMHFFNLFVFTRIRSSANNKPPVMPDGFTELGA